MDEPNINAWWLNGAIEQNPIDRVVDAYLGDENDLDAFDGVRRLVLQRTSQTLDGYDGDDLVNAFNRATNDWPTDTRAWLARYEAEVRGRANDQYQTREYAETVGVMDESIQQTEIQHFEDGDTLRALSDEEQHTALLIRAVANDADPMIATEVEDHYSFRDNLRETGNPDVSMHLQHFDPDAPRRLLEEAIPPEEWESDPSHIPRYRCSICSDHHYLIETGDGPEWLSTSASEPGVEISESDNWLSGRHDFLGGCCREPWEENANFIAIDTGDGFVSGQHDHDIMRIEEHTGDVDMSNVEVINGERGSREWVSIQPDSEIGDVRDQELALEAIAHRDFEVEAGPYVIDLDQTAVWFQRDDGDTAREIKETLQEAI